MPAEQISVIIAFRTELASVLVRSIVSLLRRTPAENLGEIIIIEDAPNDDDDVDRRWLNATFVQRLHHKIRWHRNRQLIGAGASRQLAATTYAQFEYLVFLDAHSEVNVGWLPPLLHRLRAADGNGAGVLVSPALDVIDRRTWHYRRGGHWLRAGFDWALRRRWFVRTENASEGDDGGGEEFDGANWNETMAFM